LIEVASDEARLGLRPTFQQLDGTLLKPAFRFIRPRLGFSAQMGGFAAVSTDARHVDKEVVSDRRASLDEESEIKPLGQLAIGA
jgi:hypothetical protein